MGRKLKSEIARLLKVQLPDLEALLRGEDRDKGGRAWRFMGPLLVATLELDWEEWVAILSRPDSPWEHGLVEGRVIHPAAVQMLKDSGFSPMRIKKMLRGAERGGMYRVILLAWHAVQRRAERAGEKPPECEHRVTIGRLGEEDLERVVEARRLRKQLGYTLQDIGKMLGYKSSTVPLGWEDGSAVRHTVKGSRGLSPEFRLYELVLQSLPLKPMKPDPRRLVRPQMTTVGE